MHALVLLGCLLCVESSCDASSYGDSSYGDSTTKECGIYDDSTTKECGCSAGTNRQSGTAAYDPEGTLPTIFEALQRAIQTGDLNRDLVVPTPLVLIPGGLFTMGTDDPQIVEDGESPARKVKISPFKLQKYEVSNRQFSEFILETGYKTEAENFGWSFCFEATLSSQVLSRISTKVVATPWWLPVQDASWFRPNGPDKDILSEKLLDHPVTHVSHNDAKKYCEWLNLRLPREAEFERASRGGLESKGFPWGDELNPEGRFRANLWQGMFPNENLGSDGYSYASPVTAFGEQNQYGLYNIIGNAWEWVADAWTVRHRLTGPDGEVLENPLVEIRGRIDDPTVERVKKGGSYMCHISYCYRYRVESRSSNSADSSSQNLGMRCADDYDE